MDPTFTLICALEEMREVAKDDADAAYHRTYAADNLRALADWIEAGGFVPKVERVEIADGEISNVNAEGWAILRT